MSNQTTPIVHHISDADVSDTLDLCVKLSPNDEVKRAFEKQAMILRDESRNTNKEICRILLANLYAGISFGSWPE